MSECEERNLYIRNSDSELTLVHPFHHIALLSSEGAPHSMRQLVLLDPDKLLDHPNQWKMINNRRLSMEIPGIALSHEMCDPPN